MSYSHSFPGDKKGDNTFARFYTEEVKDEVASAKEGRAIYRSEERVEIFMPGNNLTRHVKKVDDGDRERFATHYERFKAGQQMAHDGTPIEMWPILTPAQVRELKAMEIWTIEQCAGLTDIAISRIGMGGRALRDRAKAYLDDAERIALTERLTHDKERNDAKIADLERRLAEMQVILDQQFRQISAQAAMPNAVQAYVPQPLPSDMMVPVSAEPSSSSLDSLGAVPRRRGRPSNAEIAAREKETA